MRMCADYRALNKVLMKNKNPISLIAYLFDRLPEATFFTKLHWRSGYGQVRITVSDEGKMTCVLIMVHMSSLYIIQFD